MNRRLSFALTIFCFVLAFATLGYFYWGIVKAIAPLLLSILFILLGLMSWGHFITLNEKATKKLEKK
jgi:predicted membrane channel-forming protein YqfA (hemolysin III family)